MSTARILVRGAARSFDDIYEGTKLEVIAKRDELMKLVAHRFSVSEWSQSSTRKNSWIGLSTLSHATCELLVGHDDNVVMLTIDGVNLFDIISFSTEMRLEMFD